MGIVGCSTPGDSHGRELHSCRLGDIRIAEVAVPPGLRLGRHRHEAGQIVFVLEGSYRERWRHRSVELGPGTAIFRPPGEAHANEFGREEVLALLVAYPPDRLSGLDRAPRPRDVSWLLGDLKVRIEMEWRREDAASRMALEGISLLLLARTLRAPSDDRAPEWVRAAMALIEQKYAETISLADVADEVELHRATVAAGFRRWLGRSVGEAISEVRLARALEQIRSAKRPLAEIAVECGYFDQSHMGRHVKRATGATPGQIRRLH